MLLWKFGRGDCARALKNSGELLSTLVNRSIFPAFGDWQPTAKAVETPSNRRRRPDQRDAPPPLTKT